MKTFVMRLLIIAGLVGAYDLDHSTTPEVVRISKESSILRTRKCGILVEMSQLEAQSDHSESDKNADWGFSGLSEKY
jgi:hypothetical protein